MPQRSSRDVAAKRCSESGAIDAVPSACRLTSYAARVVVYAADSSLLVGDEAEDNLIRG